MADMIMLRILRRLFWIIWVNLIQSQVSLKGKEGDGSVREENVTMEANVGVVRTVDQRMQEDSSSWTDRKGNRFYCRTSREHSLLTL